MKLANTDVKGQSNVTKMLTQLSIHFEKFMAHI